MKKRILAVLLALCMMLGMVPGTAWAIDIIASGECGENVTWELDSEGTLTIEGAGAISDYSNNSAGDQVPWKENLYNIERVIISDGVTRIGKGAFAGGYLKLHSVSIPSSVKSIGISSFASCTNLTSVTIPEGVSSIGDYAFSGCENLRSVLIPSSVTEMGSEVFSGIYGEGKIYFNGDFPDVGQSPIPNYVTVYYVQGTSWWDTVPAANLKLVEWSGGNEVPVTEKAYEITYELSGGRGDFPPIKLFSGVKVWAPSNIPTREGCKFDGWYDVNDEENDADNLFFAHVYEPGKINNSFRMPERNVVLKAIWVDPVTGTFVPGTDDEDPPNPDNPTQGNPLINDDHDALKLKQPSGSVICPLVSSTMMLQCRAVLDGNEHWNTITTEKVRKFAWTNEEGDWEYCGAIKPAFIYRDDDAGIGMSVKETENIEGSDKSYFINLLNDHPEGIVIWDAEVLHAILLTNYDSVNDCFYCADPVGYIKAGRILLTESYLGEKIEKDDETILKAIDRVWYVSDHSNNLKSIEKLTFSSHCPVEMRVSAYDMILDSRNVSDTESNEYITMTVSGSGQGRNVTTSIENHYTIENNIGIELLGTDAGVMTFIVEYLCTDGTIEKYTFQNVPVKQTIVGTVTNFYPQSTLVLTLNDFGITEIWAANPNEIASVPSIDIDNVISTGLV